MDKNEQIEQSINDFEDTDDFWNQQVENEEQEQQEADRRLDDAS